MITDLNQTIDAVVDSSTLPMSVVIVGVQNEVLRRVGEEKGKVGLCKVG